MGGLVSVSVGILQVNSCYNTGSIIGRDNVGGLVGSHKRLYDSNTPGKATITNCYNVGTITGTTNLGGIMGYDIGGNYAITNTYYLENGNLLNIGTVANNKSWAKSETDMKSPDFVTLLGANFTSDTTPPTNNGYPILKP